MAKSSRPITGTFRAEFTSAIVVRKLPDELAVQLGHIASIWSLIEQCIKYCIYIAIPIDQVAGRLVIGTARQSDQLKKLEQLLTVRKFKIATDIDKLQRNIASLEIQRDKFIHAHWSKMESGEFCIPDIEGQWNLGPGFPSLRKRAFPAPAIVTAKTLSDFVMELEKAVEELEKLLQDLAANVAPTLRKIVRARMDVLDQSQDQTAEVVMSQRPPFLE